MSWRPRPLSLPCLSTRSFNCRLPLKDVEMAARALGLQVQVSHVSIEHDLDIVFASLSIASRWTCDRCRRLFLQSA